MEDGKLLKSKRGTPQGGLISPVLANVYLHYVLDEWFETDIKSRFSNCHLIRYCDDFVVCFQNEDDANCFYNEVQLRFYEFKLELESTKTRIINLADNPSLNFLGYTISVGKDVNNQYNTTFTVSSKKLDAKKDEMKKYIQNNKDGNMSKFVDVINSKLRGFYNYYKTKSNQPYLEEYYNYTLLQLNNNLSKKQLKQLKLLLEKKPLEYPPTRDFLEL